MQILDHMALLGPLDLAAAGAILIAWFVISWMIEHAGAKRPSVTVLMSERRRDWMKVFVTRDPRIFDSQILASLRQGNRLKLSVKDSPINVRTYQCDHGQAL